MFRHVLLITGISIVLFSLFGCDNTSNPDDNPPLVGTWKMTVQYVISPDGTIDTTVANDLFGNTYTFKNNNTVDITALFIGIPINYSGTWSEKGDSVSIVLSDTIISTWAYELSGSALTMTKGEDTGNGIETTIEKYVKQ